MSEIDDSNNMEELPDKKLRCLDSRMRNFELPDKIGINGIDGNNYR